MQFRLLDIQPHPRFPSHAVVLFGKSNGSDCCSSVIVEDVPHTVYVRFEIPKQEHEYDDSENEVMRLVYQELIGLLNYLGIDCFTTPVASQQQQYYQFRTQNGKEQVVNEITRTSMSVWLGCGYDSEPQQQQQQQATADGGDGGAFCGESDCFFKVVYSGKAPILSIPETVRSSLVYLKDVYNSTANVVERFLVNKRLLGKKGSLLWIRDPYLHPECAATTTEVGVQSSVRVFDYRQAMRRNRNDPFLTRTTHCAQEWMVRSTEMVGQQQQQHVDVSDECHVDMEDDDDVDMDMDMDCKEECRVDSVDAAATAALRVSVLRTVELLVNGVLRVAGFCLAHTASDRYDTECDFHIHLAPVFRHLLASEETRKHRKRHQHTRRRRRSIDDDVSPYLLAEVDANHWEQEVLEELVNALRTYDPDVIMGHDLYSEQGLAFLLGRMRELGVKDWCAFGRFKSSAFTMQDYRLYNSIQGRYVCDVRRFCSESGFRGYDTYSLEELSRKFLGRDSAENTAALVRYSPVETYQYFLDEQSVQRLAETLACECTTVLAVESKAKILALARQLSDVCGSPMSAAFHKGRSYLIEWFYLHTFHGYGWISPSSYQSLQNQQRAMHSSNRGKRKMPPLAASSGLSSFQGGFVLPSKPGRYLNECVLILDFRQLYPSIVVEYELCFSRARELHNNSNTLTSESEEEQVTPDTLLDKVLLRVMEMRAEAKAESREAGDAKDIEQNTLKVVSNAGGFGALGMPGFRFFCKPVSEEITRIGRETIRRARDVVEQHTPYEIVFGDTDSIAIRTGISSLEPDSRERCKAVARELEQLINQHCSKQGMSNPLLQQEEPSHIHMRMERIVTDLFVDKKKRYSYLTRFRDTAAAADAAVAAAANEFCCEREDKGLETVRSDWSPIAKRALSRTLDAMLNIQPLQELAETIVKILKDECSQLSTAPIEDLYLHKALGQPLRNYCAQKSLHQHQNAAPRKPPHHVQVALWLANTAESGVLPPDKGNVIPYIMCTNNQPCHPTRFWKEHPLWKIDYAWYEKHQIRSLVYRITESVEGLAPLVNPNSNSSNSKSKSKRTTAAGGTTIVQ